MNRKHENKWTYRNFVVIKRNRLPYNHKTVYMIVKTNIRKMRKKKKQNKINKGIEELKQWHWLHLQSLATDQHIPFQ